MRRSLSLETVAAAVVLAAVATAAYGWYDAHGGFYLDDWSNASDYQLGHHPRYHSAVADLHRSLGGRPLLALLLPIPHALFGVHPGSHLVLATALGIVVSCSFFLLLRVLGVTALHACATAVLVLLFPWSDSVRLWSTASINSLSVCFFAIGLAAALHSVDRSIRAAAVGHAIALTFFVASVLTYEVAPAAILLAGFLYLRRTNRRRALSLWALDVLAILGTLLYSVKATVGTRHVSSIGDSIHDLRDVGRAAVLLGSDATLPIGRADSLGKGLVVALLGAAVVVGALIQLHRRRAEHLRTWLQAVGMSVVGVAAADVMMLGSGLHPLDPGIDNRINIFTTLPYAVLAYAVVMLGLLLLTGGRAPEAAVALVAVGALAAGYAVRLVHDESAWTRAASIQHSVLARITEEPIDLRRHDVLILFGAPSESAPGVPVFDRSWDLTGALRLQEREGGLRGLPVFPGVSIRCGSSSATVTGPGSYGTFSVSYADAVLLDLSSQVVVRPKDAEACKKSVGQFL